MCEQTCTHHWLLPTPDGPTCIGRCKKCGEEREFSNSLPNDFRTTPIMPPRGHREPLGRFNW